MTVSLARGLSALCVAAVAFQAHADEIQVAVAANFSAAAQKIAAHRMHPSSWGDARAVPQNGPSTQFTEQPP